MNIHLKYCVKTGSRLYVVSRSSRV